jgi:hypothetical protein
MKTNHHSTFPYKPILILLFFILVNPALSQVKTSLGNGNWSTASNWSPSGVPTATNDVVIASSHVINMTSNGICRSLTVGTGGAAQLRFSDMTARSLTVTGNIVVGNSAQIVVTANAHQTLVAGGDITNNGTLDFYQNVNRDVTLLLNKNGNQNISGSGILSNFGPIRLQMGSSFNNIADFSTSSFLVQSDFLTLINGTFKYSTTSTTNITPYSTAVTIPATGGLWMNAPSAVMNLSSGIIVAGKLSNSNGTLSIGDVSDETLLYSGGTFSFTGGVTKVAGRFSGNAAASTCNFNMSGGTFSVPAIASTNLTDAPFQIGATGSQFNMSGGIISLVREGGTGTQDLAYVNLAGSGTVNGGTVEIGNALSPASQIFKINSSALIPNLVLNNSTATASLLTNALTVTNTIKITAGTLNSNNLGITLGGNWENNGGIFTPGTSTVTFNSSAAQSIFKSGGETFNHLRFSGTGTKTFSAPVTAGGNFSISTGSPVDVSASNHSLTVRGNFINSGTFTARSGLVFFNGIAAQTIGGNSTTDFFNITLTNAAGASLTHAENLIGTLTLSGGAFNTNLQLFTMVSTATATARVAQITGTGDIVGPVKVQRFVPGGTTGWGLWGTPISSALSFADWDDNIGISCPTCPDGYVPGFYSIYSYNEAAVGTYSDYFAYTPIGTVNDPIVPNTGYWVYVGDGPTTTNGITVDVTGTLRKGPQTIPLGYTNYGSPADDGWNLIHNPYPSPISWTSLRGATSNIDNAIYVYNADLNGGTGGNAIFVNGVSSPAAGSGGIGDNIPMSQGFYVHSTGATQLNATEAIKVASTQTYLRENSQTTPSLVRINMSSANAYNFNDEIVVYTQVGASANFDNDFDAIKMSGQDPYAPFIAIEEGANLMQVNAVTPISGTYTTALKALTGYAGSYTISLSELNFLPGACVKLFDKFTNTTADLVAGSYVFFLSDTTTVARFILSITLDPLQITANLNQPTCQIFNAGKIEAIGNSAGPWNYYWKDGYGNPIKTSLNITTSDTLSGLYTGSYQLDVTTVGACDNSHSNYIIIDNHKAYSSFSAVDTCLIDQDPVITFYNTTPHAVSQIWDFGDSNSSTAFSPQYQYQTTGNYLVRLISNSSTGCVDTAEKTIVVSNKPVGIKTNTLNGGLKVHTLSGSHYLLQQELTGSGILSYTLKDVQARQVLEQSKHSVNRVYIDLDLSALEAGVYFLSLQLDDKISVIKLGVSK